MIRYGFNIRTKTGQRVDNIQIMAASMGDAERRLRQMYLQVRNHRAPRTAGARPHRGRRHAGRQCPGPHRPRRRTRPARIDLLWCTAPRDFGGASTVRALRSDGLRHRRAAPNACRQLPSATPCRTVRRRSRGEAKDSRKIRATHGDRRALPAQHRDPRRRPGQADALRACRRCCIRSAAGRCSPTCSTPRASSPPTASASSTATAATPCARAFPSPTSLGAAGSAAGHRPCAGAGAAAARRRRRDARAVRRRSAGARRRRWNRSSGTRGSGALSLLTIELDDPTGYGRIVRGAGRRGDGHRRAQGRDARAARDPRDQHRRDGGADRALRPLARRPSTTATRAASTT